MNDQDRTHRMLSIAARAALRGMGRVEPNPMVGCVIARGDEVLGIGHHTRFGQLHAEREALESCKRQGHDPRGATCYVTLEPCSHTGKQPPCTDALIEAGIARVVAAVEDPGEASGGGFDVLRKAGIDCAFAEPSEEAGSLADAFRQRAINGRPWVIGKWAQTIDGRVATRTGESKWLTGPAARRRVHRLRGIVDAIITGINTVQKDDPELTARGVPVRRVARRIVIDRGLQIPNEARLLRQPLVAPVSIVCGLDEASSDRAKALRDLGVEVMGAKVTNEGRLDLNDAIRRLSSEHEITTMMTECGPRLLGAIDRHVGFNELRVYVAPRIFGDKESRMSIEGDGFLERLDDADRFRLLRVKRVGDNDIELTYRFGDVPGVHLE